MFLLISVHANTNVLCLILLLLPSICRSVFEHKLYHVVVVVVVAAAVVIVIIIIIIIIIINACQVDDIGSVFDPAGFLHKLTLFGVPDGDYVNWLPSYLILQTISCWSGPVKVYFVAFWNRTCSYTRICPGISGLPHIRNDVSSVMKPGRLSPFRWWQQKFSCN